MEASLWVSKTGLDAQQMRMTVISNNLANVNTVGFKRDRAVFEAEVESAAGERALREGEVFRDAVFNRNLSPQALRHEAQSPADFRVRLRAELSSPTEGERKGEGEER